MPLRIDVFHHLIPHTDPRIDQVLAQLGELGKAVGDLGTLVRQQGAAMTQQLDTLKQKVQETTDVEQSAIELLGTLSSQIAALKDDPAALQALADSLDTKKSALAAAIVANTPAAP